MTAPQTATAEEPEQQALVVADFSWRESSTVVRFSAMTPR
jgi:hypothetical protein